MNLLCCKMLIPGRLSLPRSFDWECSHCEEEYEWKPAAEFRFHGVYFKKVKGVMVLHCEQCHDTLRSRGNGQRMNHRWIQRAKVCPCLHAWTRRMVEDVISGPGPMTLEVMVATAVEGVREQYRSDTQWRQEQKVVNVEPLTKPAVPKKEKPEPKPVIFTAAEWEKLRERERQTNIAWSRAELPLTAWERVQREMVQQPSIEVISASSLPPQRDRPMQIESKGADVYSHMFHAQTLHRGLSMNREELNVRVRVQVAETDVWSPPKRPKDKEEA